jgi:hypothetical protein
MQIPLKRQGVIKYWDAGVALVDTCQAVLKAIWGMKILIPPIILGVMINSQGHLQVAVKPLNFWCQRIIRRCCHMANTPRKTSVIEESRFKTDALSETKILCIPKAVLWLASPIKRLYPHPSLFNLIPYFLNLVPSLRMWQFLMRGGPVFGKWGILFHERWSCSLFC